MIAALVLGNEIVEIYSSHGKPLDQAFGAVSFPFGWLSFVLPQIRHIETSGEAETSHTTHKVFYITVFKKSFLTII